MPFRDLSYTIGASYHEQDCGCLWGMTESFSRGWLEGRYPDADPAWLEEHYWKIRNKHGYWVLEICEYHLIEELEKDGAEREATDDREQTKHAETDDNEPGLRP